LEPAWAAAAGDPAPSPGREGRFTSPLAVRVGRCGGSVSHAGGSDSPGAGVSKTDLEGETGRWSDDRAAGSTGPHPGAGGATGSGGQGTGCGSRAGGDGSAGPPAARAAPLGRIPWGGVTGALVTASVVSRGGGMWTVAVTPLPGELSRRTPMPWRAARFPAT
jgi:hypothetical protein